MKQSSVYIQLFMKEEGSKNKFTANNARVNSATPGFLGMLSGSSCNKNNNYQTSPCYQFYKIQVEVPCKIPWQLLALYPTSISIEVNVFETILAKNPWHHLVYPKSVLWVDDTIRMLSKFNTRMWFFMQKVAELWNILWKDVKSLHKLKASPDLFMEICWWLLNSQKVYSALEVLEMKVLEG